MACVGVVHPNGVLILAVVPLSFVPEKKVFEPPKRSEGEQREAKLKLAAQRQKKLRDLRRLYAPLGHIADTSHDRAVANINSYFRVKREQLKKG